MQIRDDPDHPATLWSFLEYEDEIDAINALTKAPNCFVFLFNELAVNVAWGQAIIDLSGSHIGGILKDAILRVAKEIDNGEKIGHLLDSLHRGDLPPSVGIATDYLEVPEWHPIENYYITNAASRSLVSIFETNEGASARRGCAVADR